MKSVMAGLSSSNLQFYDKLHQKYFNKAKPEVNEDKEDETPKDLAESEVNMGTISSYSISSKSKNALSINLKNSIYKKTNNAGDEGMSQITYSQLDNTKHKTKSRSRGRRTIDIGASTIEENESSDQIIVEKNKMQIITARND